MVICYRSLRKLMHVLSGLSVFRFCYALFLDMAARNKSFLKYQWNHIALLLKTFPQLPICSWSAIMFSLQFLLWCHLLPLSCKASLLQGNWSPWFTSNAWSTSYFGTFTIVSTFRYVFSQYIHLTVALTVSFCPMVLFVMSTFDLLYKVALYSPIPVSCFIPLFRIAPTLFDIQYVHLTICISFMSFMRAWLLLVYFFVFNCCYPQ